MKIGIVSKSNTHLRVLSGVISESAAHSVAWVLSDKTAIAESCQQHATDLLLLDVLLLSKQEKQWLGELLEVITCPILVGAAKMDGNESAIFEAMRWGALDVAVIPDSQSDELGAHELLRKLSIISKLSSKERVTGKPQKPVSRAAATPTTGAAAPSATPCTSPTASSTRRATAS